MIFLEALGTVYMRLYMHVSTISCRSQSSSVLFIPQTMYLRRAAAEKMKRLLSLGLVTPKVFGFRTYLSIQTGTVEFESKRHQDTRVFFFLCGFPIISQPWNQGILSLPKSNKSSWKSMDNKDVQQNPGWWFQQFLSLTPKIGEMIHFDKHISQIGWFNHQLESQSISPKSFSWVSWRVPAPWN